MKKKKKKEIVLSRKTKLELASQIYDLMVQGGSDSDIIDTLSIDPQTYLIAKKFLLEMKALEEESMSSKERYAQYVINQQRNILDLDELTTNLNSKTQYNALVGAIRLRADIFDRLITTGQTLGVINKEPEKRVVLGGVAIADLKDKELRRGVVKAFAGLERLIKKYGDGKKLSDIKPGKIHYGEAVGALPEDLGSTASLGAPPMKEPSKDKRNKAKTGKRSAGRRRTR